MHDPYKPHPLWGSTPPIILGRKVLQRVSPAEYPVRTDPIYGCWRWEGPLTGGGYSSLRLDSGTVVGHRHLYELVWGPIPDGYVIDHLCRRPSCVRPVHLEAVTKGENEARKQWRRRVKRTECPFGHSLSKTKTITHEGGVVCRDCNRGREDWL